MSENVIAIRRGRDVRLEGPPAPDIADIAAKPARVAVQPGEYRGLKPRLMVKEGDPVRKGAPLFCDKADERFRVCSPAGGVVREIRMGPRRALEYVAVEPDAGAEAETFPRWDLGRLASAPRDDLLDLLLRTGYLALLRQRPFSGRPNPSVQPKSIFVNAMNTAPFEADFGACVKGNEAAFHAGLLALTRLTEGPVFLCLAPDTAVASGAAALPRVQVRRFKGPHPAGNTSVHIHHLDAISPGDTVWTVRAADLVLIGQLLLGGSLPDTRVIALGGPGVKPAQRRHYRVRIGCPIADIVRNRLEDGEQRLISGDALAGEQLAPSDFLPFLRSAVTVAPEGRNRRFMAWAGPGIGDYSLSRLFLSGWTRGGRRYALDTNLHGGHRPMIVTGLYDRYVPMNIMTDFLVRAVLAKDTEEAVQLGLLEVDPEDFALAAFACPSKTDLPAIIRKGLDDVEAEGI